MPKSNILHTLWIVDGLVMECARAVFELVYKLCHRPQAWVGSLVVHNSWHSSYPSFTQPFPHTCIVDLKIGNELLHPIHRHYVLLLLRVYRNIVISNGGWKMLTNSDNGWEARSGEL